MTHRVCISSALAPTPAPASAHVPASAAPKPTPDQIKAVIFDMDGLMFDTERLVYKIYLEAAQKFGFSFTPEIFYYLAGRSSESIIQVLQNMYGPTHNARSWREWVIARRVEKLTQIDYRVDIKPGLRDLISALQRHQIPYCIASSSRREAIERYLKATDLADDFTRIISVDDVSHAKPNPEIFLKAAECLHAEPSSVLVLEDSMNGLRAAQAGGLIAGFVYDDLSDLPSVAHGFSADTSCLSLGYPSLWDYSRALADISFTSLAEVARYLCAR